MVTLNPYLSFQGQAREAMDFYRSALGGDLTVTTFAEGGMAGGDPASADLVMHSTLTTPGGLTLMGADSPPGMPYTPGDNVAVSLSGGPEDEAELRRCYERLAEEARSVLPLERAPWGDHFGMLTDRFGIGWMVNIAGETA
jgi:PhnB protein